MQFDLKIWNPCVNSAYNAVTVPADYLITYVINGETTIIDYTVGFNVELETLCGGLTLTPTGMTTEVTEASNTLEVKTLDLTKIGVKQVITIKSVLTNYQTAVTIPDVIITVEFLDCLVSIV